MRNIIGFLLFLAAILFGFGVLLPKLALVRAVNIEKTATLQAVEMQKQRLAALETLKSQFAQNASRVQSLIAVLPDNPDYATSLVTLEAMMKESGVSVQSYTPLSRVGDTQAVIRVSGEAELSQVEKLAQLAADNNRPISLGAATLSRLDSGKLAFSFTFVLPFHTKEVL